MELNQPLQSRIESLIDSDRVVLFMKGTRMQPQCGFSAATVGILDSLVPRYTTFNVLEDQGIRRGSRRSPTGRRFRSSTSTGSSSAGATS